MVEWPSERKKPLLARLPSSARLYRAYCNRFLLANALRLSTLRSSPRPVLSKKALYERSFYRPLTTRRSVRFRVATWRTLLRLQPSRRW